MGLTPETVEERCKACSDCVEVCPTGAISVNGAARTDSKKPEVFGVA